MRVGKAREGTAEGSGRQRTFKEEDGVGIVLFDVPILLLRRAELRAAWNLNRALIEVGVPLLVPVG